ncbi:hypothetical protein HDU67_010114 [Dinochytrium kinnereticum]|nr:hypothetical protein HDU67_010114 [Dinochytrium kinnereticum]
MAPRVKMFRLLDVLEPPRGDVKLNASSVKSFCRDGEAVVVGAARMGGGGNDAALLEVWLGMWVDERTPDNPPSTLPPGPTSNQKRRQGEDDTVEPTGNAGDAMDPDLKIYLDSQHIWGEERELVRIMTQHREEFSKVVKAIIVGSEALFRGDQTLDETIARVRRVRNILEIYGFSTSLSDPNRIIVTVADLAGSYYYPDALIEEVDVVMVNENIPVQEASQHQFILHEVMQSRVHQLHTGGKLSRFQPQDLPSKSTKGEGVAPTPQVIFGEVGWPTAGDVLGAAIPSVSNLEIVVRGWNDPVLLGSLFYCAPLPIRLGAAMHSATEEKKKKKKNIPLTQRFNVLAFAPDWSCKARARSVGYFWFEFCDERWKPEWHGGVEQHWGLLDDARVAKSTALLALAHDGQKC